MKMKSSASEQLLTIYHVDRLVVYLLEMSEDVLMLTVEIDPDGVVHRAQLQQNS